jgi:alkylation response protein AidB-like acyl-CoA dehydrogenase
VPYFDSVALASTALLACEQNPVAQQWLKRLASGQAMGAMALPDPQSSPLTSPRAEATPSGWLLNGEWTQVGSAAMADCLLLSAYTPNGEPVLLLMPADAPGLVVQPQTSVDATRRAATVRCQGVALSGDHAIAQGAGLDALLARVRAWGAIALAGEQLGVAQQCLDMTLAYVAQRNQFDRAIASFQAVKHRCAQMLVALESARSAVYSAACEADTSPPAAALLRLAAQARVAATEAAQFCAREALQLHGGVGFTWEYDPHLFLRRAQASSQRLGLGSVAWWLEQVAEQLLGETEEML